MAGKVSDNLDEMAEINVTPLVDVMLVLLIIFIITAPMLVQGLKVNLPKQDAPAIAGQSDEPLVLTLNTDQIITGTAVTMGGLGFTAEEGSAAYDRGG